MKKLVICLSISFLFGSMSFAYDNKGGYNNETGYNQSPYVQEAYVQTPYNNNVNYMKEFIKGDKREQKVQRVRKDGSTVQAIIEVGTPEEKGKEIKN